MQLAKIRQKRGLTQQELAEKVSVSRALISMVEIGSVRAYPLLRRRIAKALNTEEEKIFR